MFIPALFIIAKDWKCLSVKNWPKMVNTYSEIQMRILRRMTQSLPIKKRVRQDGFLVEFYQTFQN